MSGGVSAARPDIAAVATLLKPITWFAPMWAFACGVVSAWQPAAPHAAQIVLGVALVGPLVCGAGQAANDWYDRHVDAINEPGRPIPSGRIPGQWGLIIALAWTAVSLAVAASIGKICFAAALVGLALGWAYSAPPLRLKRNGWLGNAACGACYEGLPWITGCTILTGGVPPVPVFAAAALYSLGAHGIMTLNDFKSVEGDRAMGVGSLPVRLGIKRAAVVACLMMAVPQGVVMVLLSIWGKPVAAALVGMVLFAQLLLMRRMLQKPRDLAAWYNGTGTSLYVLGMMVCAVALRP
ncbi:MAG TPA: chlorophyll synthase ChlG [Acetobacteraceae bacterium]|nr:chlorophyll synthase ChlG [Acetobacteraceae bacterium]